MKKEIRISIIIPIYNAEKYLKRCIESIITQSLKEIEIICVNDGSIDNSLEILKKFQEEDKRIIIINKENGGASSARNSALKIAKGEYCLNIDSDDWIEQGYLEAIYNRAKKDDLDITISNIIFDFKDKSQKNYNISDLDINDKKIITGKEYINLFFSGNGYGYTWNKLIKRDVYFKNNLWYDEKIFLLEDVEILMTLSYYAQKIGKLNKAYYHYIQGENNGSKKIKVDRLYDILTCMNNLIKFYSEKNENEILNLIKQDKYLHLLSRIVEDDYLEKEEYEIFVLKFIKSIKNEKKIEFREKLSEQKYKKFLIFIIRTLKVNNTKVGMLVLKLIKFLLKIKHKFK